MEGDSNKRAPARDGAGGGRFGLRILKAALGRGSRIPGRAWGRDCRIPGRVRFASSNIPPKTFQLKRAATKVNALWAPEGSSARSPSEAQAHRPIGSRPS